MKKKNFNRAFVFMCRTNGGPLKPTIAIATEKKALKEEFDSDFWVSESEALKLYHSLEKALAYINDVREGRSANHD